MQLSETFAGACEVMVMMTVSTLARASEQAGKQLLRSFLETPMQRRCSLPGI